MVGSGDEVLACRACYDMIIVVEIGGTKVRLAVAAMYLVHRFAPGEGGAGGGELGKDVIGSALGPRV